MTSISKRGKIAIVASVIASVTITAIFGYQLIYSNFVEWKIADLYRNILHRSPDTKGMAYFKDQVIHKGKSLDGVENTVRVAPEAIAVSKITQLYQTILNRDSDPEGMVYFQYEVLQNGKSYDWVEQQIRNSTEAKSLKQ